MSELRTILSDELDELRAARDELRVRLHLGRADVRDQWKKLEKALQHAEAKARVMKGATAETAEEIGAAARLLVDEVREGYEHLRRLF